MDFRLQNNHPLQEAALPNQFFPDFLSVRVCGHGHADDPGFLESFLHFGLARLIGSNFRELVEGAP